MIYNSVHRVNVDDLIENENNRDDSRGYGRILDSLNSSDYDYVDSYVDDDVDALSASRTTHHKLHFCGKTIKLTRSQLITIVLLSAYFFLTSCYYALFAPFLPGEAIKKGISQTQVGIIFGIFQFVLLILSPLFGKYMDVIGIRFLFVSGLFLSSCSEFIFGLLNMCPDGMIYFSMCILCRIVTAIGSSMGLSYAIVGYYFPNKMSSIVAMLEVFNGLGLMIGPPLGGFLYSAGGFQLPFFLMGGLLFLVFIAAFFTFPYVETRRRLGQQNGNETVATSAKLMPLLKKPKFLLTLCMLLSGSLSIGFIEPSIQLHLTPLQLTPTQLGLILFIPSLLYVIVTPIVGHFCDKYPKVPPWFMLLSALSSGISFCFLGPIPWLNLPLKLWIFLSGFVAFGFSIGGLIIPVYSQLVKIALENGYNNDLKTQGLISGVFSSVWSLGALVGPVVGGIVVDNIGFELASFSIVVLFFVVDLFYAIFHISGQLCKRIGNDNTSLNTQTASNYYQINRDESSPLLRDYSD